MTQRLFLIGLKLQLSCDDDFFSFQNVPVKRSLPQNVAWYVMTLSILLDIQ